MATISVTNPSDGQTIDASDVATPINTIVAAINGNLDDDNIKTGANINGTKLLANSVPPTAGDANFRAGWNTGILPAPNTITYNGNRNYSVVFNTTDLTSYISNGMRLRLTRTVAAPTQCTSLNGTTQYYSKSSPSAMTFTDDFTVSAWIKLSSYANGVIAARWNGTSGWYFIVTSTGQLQLAGTNAASANFSYVQSYQSVPLNKWVHVAAQLDMSTFTATTTTSYVMIDGLDAPASVVRGGTNPTALVQAGNLEIGATVAGTQWFFPGKIAQVAIYNAKVTQATVAASISQTLSGSETSLISAYSFNNSINDLSATANNLTAQGSAVATNADSPFGGQADGTISTTLDYGIVTKTAFSTNTTLTVQVPEGCTIPTSGGVTSLAYSVHKAPYGMPTEEEKWTVLTSIKAVLNVVGPVSGTWYNPSTTSASITVPVGQWVVSWSGNILADRAAAGALSPSGTLSTANNSESDPDFTATAFGNNVTQTGANMTKSKGLSLSASTPYYLNVRVSAASVTTLYINGETQIKAKLATL